jgi:peptidoglycan/LPS O-acetylase OafA/YrhL
MSSSTAAPPGAAAVEASSARVPAQVAEMAPTGDPTSVGRPHLWQVDIVRLLTFAAVIWVHSLAFTEQPDNRLAAGLMMLLQFGRELFFALTGFVLVYSVGPKALKIRSFWRKRVVYVAVPYVTWSAIYYAYTVLGPAHAPASWSDFGVDLLDGNAMYHLYFLLVTLQLYLMFPLILNFVRRTAHIAGRVLVVASVLNLAWLAVLQYAPNPTGGPGLWVYQHAYELLPSYTMYILAGCYGALHLDRLQRLVDTRRRLLMSVAAASTAAALAVYACQLGFEPPRVADGVLQPGMALSCLAAVIAIYVIGTRWAEGPRPYQNTIEALSDASFGVYLAHPLILAFLLDFVGFGNTDQKMPAVLATVFGFVIAAGGATALSLAARRTPLSLPLTGRPWRAQVKRHSRAGQVAAPPLVADRRAAAC